MRAEKLFYRRFATIDPFLMTLTIIACFVSASGADSPASSLAAAAGVAFSVMLSMTLVGNVPINLRILQWDETGTNTEKWRRLRGHWDRLHTARIVLDCTGFLLITLSLSRS